MLSVVFPRALNWFYQEQAKLVVEDLARLGVAVEAVASSRPDLLPPIAGGTVLVVSVAESFAAAERAGMAGELLRALQRFERRVLLNFDSIHSPWFARHFAPAASLVSEVFDVGLYRQVVGDEIRGVPCRFVPEAFAGSVAARVSPWTPGRRVPWAVLGHATRDRTALVEAALQDLSPNGFVFSPPLRPFTERSGLEYADLRKLLAQSDIYLWGSHHGFPYHETQRALHAVEAGAVPVKIDPLHALRMPEIPWVYPSLDAMRAAREAHGLEGLWRRAHEYLVAQGSLGGNVRAALEAGRPAEDYP